MLAFRTLGSGIERSALAKGPKSMQQIAGPEARACERAYLDPLDL